MDQSFEELKRATPRGWRAFLPTNDNACDLTRLIEIEHGLKLPFVVSRGHDVEAWLKRTLARPAISNRAQLMRFVECLRTLLDEGQEPQHRKPDLEFVYWEIVLDEGLSHLRQKFGFQDGDNRRVLTHQEVTSWMSQHPIDTETRSTLTVLCEGWKINGVMSTLGYRVGLNGVQKMYRRDALRTALCVDLPPSWGGAGTHGRLRRITQALKTFLRFNEHQNAPPDRDHTKAISEYRADLDWIKEQWGFDR